MACSLQSEKEAKHYLKITLARRKTRRGSETKFPWWLPTSFTQGDSGWPMRSSYPFHKDISLSPSFIFLSLQIPPSLITTPSSHLWGTSQTSPFSTHYPPSFGVALGPGGRAVLRVARRSEVHAVRARLQTVVLCCVSAEITVMSPDEQVNQRSRTVQKLFIYLLNLPSQLLWENPIHTKVREVRGLVKDINISALSAGTELLLQLLHNTVQLTERQPSRIKSLAARTRGNSTVNKATEYCKSKSLQE